MINSVIKTCRDFVEKVLEKEDWFRQLTDNKDYDLLLLTGTAVEQAKDKLSDIDIFLVCKYEIQIKYSLKPVRIFNYKGKIFEVSILSTEKLFNDRYDKENIHWWHHTHIIKSFNKDAEKALSQASSLTRKEFLDRLWTNFVYFKINTADIEKQIKRKEPISVRLLFNENIKLIIDSELVRNGEFPSWKQFGRTLYRMGDITAIKSGQCPCGRDSIRIDRIKRRTDDLIFIKGIKIDPYELKEHILEIAWNNIYSDIKIIVRSDFGNYRPEILVSLKDPSNTNLLAFIQKSLKDKTLLTFDIKHISRDYFQRGENNKVKFVEYVDKK